MPTRKQTKKINSGPFVRSATFDARAVNEETREVELAFSSETPVERWFGWEILDHSPESVRLDRLNDNGAVLVDHSVRDLVAVVETSRIDDDRKGRARVRFGSSERAEEIFRDVKEGIRTKVSVGYRIHRMVLEEESDGIETYRAVDWEPYEITFTQLPADVSVGVGRAESETAENVLIIEREIDMPSESTTTNPVVEAPAVDVSAERSAAASNERARVLDITRAARESGLEGIETLAERFIDNGRSVEDFRDIIEQVRKATPAAIPNEPVTELGLSANDVRSYSLIRAINAQLSGNWAKAGFERECSDQIAELVGRDARGFFVPYEIQQRDMNVTNSAGLVGTDHLAGNFIDNLRANAVALRLGATVLPGLQGNVDIPKGTADPTFAWVADDADGTESDAGIGSVAMSPKTLTGQVPMSRRLLKQSSPSVESYIMRILAVGAALGLDKGIFSGTGVGAEPTGILAAVGVNTQSIAASAGTGYPTWAETVGFETAVGEDNALMGRLAYVTTAGIRGGMKTTAKDTGSGRFICEDNEANGYPVEIAQHLAAKSIIFGNFESIIVGLWGVLDVLLDTAAKAKSGGLVTRVFQDADVGLAHAESFCKNA